LLFRKKFYVSKTIGGLDQSIRIEVFGDLHEYGALGKTVTVQQALEQVTTSNKPGISKACHKEKSLSRLLFQLNSDGDLNKLF
jgi:hypothetical protein